MGGGISMYFYPAAGEIFTSLRGARRPVSAGRRSAIKLAGKARVLIVDGHPIFREGLVQFINRQRDLANGAALVTRAKQWVHGTN